jgi:hypothetical protein
MPGGALPASRAPAAVPPAAARNVLLLTGRKPKCPSRNRTLPGAAGRAYPAHDIPNVLR